MALKISIHCVIIFRVNWEKVKKKISGILQTEMHTAFPKVTKAEGKTKLTFVSLGKNFR